MILGEAESVFVAGALEKTGRPYQEGKRLLHHFYDPFPTVEHYEQTWRAQ
jgi:hypothetical protein